MINQIYVKKVKKNIKMLKAIKQKSKNGLNFFNLKNICKGKGKKALKVQLNDFVCGDCSKYRCDRWITT